MRPTLRRTAGTLVCRASCPELRLGRVAANGGRSSSLSGCLFARPVCSQARQSTSAAPTLFVGDGEILATLPQADKTIHRVEQQRRIDGCE